MKTLFQIIIAFFISVFATEGLASCSKEGDYTLCYGASNFGLGGTVMVPARFDAAKDESNRQDCELIRAKPKTRQIAPWTKTPDDLITTGVGKDVVCGKNPQDCKSKRGVLKIYVDGSWFPWGKDRDPSISANTPFNSCGPTECDDSKSGFLDPYANNSVCMKSNNDSTIGVGERVIKGSNPNDPFGIDNIPCELGGGWGLFGLLALEQDDGTFSDPNASAEVADNPDNFGFRTFRMAPLKKDNDGHYFILDYSKQCVVKNGNKRCIVDENSKGDEIVRKGRLYFQIRDRHYEDNIGGYTLNIVSGVIGPNGFIEKTVKYFESQMEETSQRMYNTLIIDTSLVGAIRMMLVLYIALYGLMIMMGLAEIKQQDAIVRVIKVALIMTLISPGSWDFFNNHLFRIFTDGAKDIAKVVMDSTLYYNNDNDSPRFILPDGANALSIYDILVNMLVSAPLQAKILGLFYYNGYFWIYIVVMYLALFFALLGIVRGVVLYFVSIMLVAVLLVIAPIFIVMMLFQITRQLFESWIQQLMAAGMMLIVQAVTMSLLVILLQNQIENLFGYSVCWSYVYTIFDKDNVFLNWKDIYWWYPNNDDLITKCVTPLNLFAFLFVCILFEKVMRDIPELIDALSNAQLTPIGTIQHRQQKYLSPDNMGIRDGS